MKRIKFLEGRRTLGDDSGAWNEIFRNCGVEEVTLPSTLQEMSPEIFKDCETLRTVWVMKGCRVDVRRFVDKKVKVLKRCAVQTLTFAIQRPLGPCVHLRGR